MSNVHCLKHGIGPENEEWKVAYEELVAESGDFTVSFRGQVCPMCYVRLIEKYRRSRREAKIQARKAVKEGQSALRYANVVRAVVAAVKELGGQDAFDLVGQKVTPSPLNRSGGPIGVQKETGKLENILPNLITELVHRAKQEGLDKGKRDIQGIETT